MYRKKIFFCLLQVMLNYRTNDITNSTFLYTEHIKPFSRKHTIHKIQNEGMSHDAQTIKSTAKIKKNHITWNRLLLHRFLYEKKNPHNTHWWSMYLLRRLIEKWDISRFHSLIRSLNHVRLSQLVRAWVLFF